MSLSCCSRTGQPEVGRFLCTARSNPRIPIHTLAYIESGMLMALEVTSEGNSWQLDPTMMDNATKSTAPLNQPSDRKNFLVQQVQVMMICLAKPMSSCQQTPAQLVPTLFTGFGNGHCSPQPEASKRMRATLVVLMSQ